MAVSDAVKEPPIKPTRPSTKPASLTDVKVTASQGSIASFRLFKRIMTEFIVKLTLIKVSRVEMSVKPVIWCGHSQQVLRIGKMKMIGVSLLNSITLVNDQGLKMKVFFDWSNH